MVWLHSFLIDTRGIAWGNVIWMGWNTLLALVPALLAFQVFRHRGRRGPAWWLGAAAFLLFLPNAPYVVTDLVHLRADVALADTDATVYAGVLPMYAGFIAIGFLSYAACLREVGLWLRTRGRALWIGRTELGLHALCAVGVVLGRMARLNSWDTVTRPDGALERAVASLTWRGAPVALLVLFLVIWVGHASTRALTIAFTAWLRGLGARSPGLAPR
jgi:uncharacterized membrane protein